VTTRIAVALWSLALVIGAGATVLTFRSNHEDSPWATAALSVSVGLAFVAAGLIAWTRRPENRTGVLMTLVGFTWFAGSLAESNASLPFTIGAAFGSVAYLFIVWLVLAYPSGELRTGLDRLLVGATAVLVFAVQPAIYLVGKNEDRCGGCPENAFLIWRQEGLADAVEYFIRGGGIAVTVAVVAVLARRWLVATPTLRRALAPVFLAATVAAALLATMLAFELVVDDVSEVLYWVVLAGLLAVPLAFLYGLLRTHLARSLVGRLVVELGDHPAPGELRDALARALRDPELEVAYWLPESMAWVDVEGQRIPPPDPNEPRHATFVERDGERVAALVHDASLLAEPELIESVSAAAGLALENERRLQELAASERRSRAVLEAIPDLMFRIARDGTYRAFKADSDRDLLTPRDQVIGHTVRERLPAHVAAKVSVGMELALAGSGVQTIEYELVFEGERRHYEGRITASGPDEVLLIVREITDRKEAEAALEVERHFLSTVFDTTPSMLCVIDPEGRIVHFNRAVEQATGLLVARVRGRHFWDAFLPPEQAEDFRRKVAQVGVEHENTLVDRNGDERTIAWWSRQLVDEEGLDRYLLCGVDITERKEHEREIHASRQRIVSAEAAERRRLERNLHDGAQQRLVALSLSLRLARAKIERAPDKARALLDEADKELSQALGELRELARGIHPAVLTDRGLEPALENLAARSPVPVKVEVPRDRLPQPVEAAAYFVVSEALANVVKYADASAVEVRIERQNGRVFVDVTDDGIGGADPKRGTGLRGLADRLSALDGKLEVESPAGRGTRVRAEIPMGAPAGKT
jgi:PAS domain S-box-containing protein